MGTVTKPELVYHLLHMHPELMIPSTKSALMTCKKYELEDMHARMHIIRETPMHGLTSTAPETR